MIRFPATRIVLLTVVILLVTIPYVVRLATHYLNSQQVSTDHEYQPPVLVHLTTPKAMYLGRSYVYQASLELVNLSKNAPVGVGNDDLLRNAECKAEAPDFIAVRVQGCAFIVSPRIAGNPMFVLHVTWPRAWKIYAGPNSESFTHQLVSVPTVHYAVALPVQEPLSLTTVSAPLAIIVAVVGLFLKGGDSKDQGTATDRLLNDIRKKKKARSG